MSDAATILRNPMRERGFRTSIRSPRWFHRRLPGYRRTPLHDAPGLAEELGVSRVLVKDEADRLGLPAFKMLGASWATYRALCEKLGNEPGGWSTIADLKAAFAPLAPLTLATATDGNHGRAVARMASLLGFESRIWVPAGTAPSRIAAIAGEGATVEQSRGGYDEAVAEAAASADARTLVISDTSWPGYETIPAWVIEGYGTILEEVDEELAERGLDTPGAAIVPIGVGAFAAAVAGHYRRGGSDATLLIGAEPADAACLLESSRAGRILTLPGPQRSIMAGLNCGTPSSIAWPAVSRAFDLFVSITDEAVIDAMRALYACDIRSGESGAAPLAVAQALAAEGLLPDLLNGRPLLLLSTEGVTDPDFYAREIVGKLANAARR